MTMASQPSLRLLTTPRAAALAGVLFALLFGAVLILIRTKMPEGVQDSTEWLTSRRSGIATATVLMPFAGISFLWFIGVVRDGLGRYEDRFFSTVFLGSGLLFLAVMFVSMSVAAGLVATNTGVTDPAAHTEMIDLGKMVVLSSTKTYAVRMAAVFMMSLATIWLRTGLMPRWLVGLSYFAAVAVLLASDLSMWVTMTFPGWVLVVSGLFLVRAGLFEELRAATIDRLVPADEPRRNDRWLANLSSAKAASGPRPGAVPRTGTYANPYANQLNMRHYLMFAGVLRRPKLPLNCRGVVPPADGFLSSRRPSVVVFHYYAKTGDVREHCGSPSVIRPSRTDVDQVQDRHVQAR